MITKEIVRNMESKFKENGYNGIITINPNFEYVDNMSKILVSAPHSVKQIREGEVKEEDLLTGFYSEYLSKVKKYNGIYRTYNDNDDPNYPIGETLPTVENLYLTEVLKIIKRDNISFLVDIHGCAERRPFDVEIISINGKSCDPKYVEIFYESFKRENFKISVDNVFKRGGQVIRQASNIGCNSVSLEINRTCRRFGDIESLERLRSMIKGIDGSLKVIEKETEFKLIKK